MFNWKKFPYTNFHELNLDYFINKFNEIFSEWENLYNTMLTWKDDTNTDLAEWKTSVENGIIQRELELREELNEWKTQTETDISTWETATLNALNTWKEATTLVFENIRATAENSAVLAEQYARGAYDNAQLAYQYKEDAEAAAESIEESAAQIETNKNDITKLKTQLSDTFKIYNIFNNPVAIYKNKTWLSGTLLAMTDNANYDICKAVIVPGSKYAFMRAFELQVPGAVRFADVNDEWISNVSGLSTPINIPDNAAFVYMSALTDNIPYGIPEADFQKFGDGYKYELINTYNEDGVTGKNLATKNSGLLNDLITPTLNLADKENFTLGKYMTNTGAIGSNAGLFYTNLMNVTPGDKLYLNYDTVYMRYVALFKDGVIVTDVSMGTTFPQTVPEGVNGVIITAGINLAEKFIVSANSPIAYEDYGIRINNKKLFIDNKNALNGNNGVTVKTDSLEADANLTIDNYPKAIGTNDRLSGCFKFETFDEATFGYGTSHYVTVDSTNMYIYANGELAKTSAHGLTIDKYLSFAIIMDKERDAHITINSLGGSFGDEYSFGYAKNGIPFVVATMAITDVELSAISTDIRKPIWWFGDSYSTLSLARVIGQLNEYGVIDNMLIDGYPGMRTYTDLTTGGYADFMKLLNFTKPKYVIWALGMNDSEANYKEYIRRINETCKTYGIELYAVKIPCARTATNVLIDNTGKNAYIDELGIKFIDWYDAVGSDTEGYWYTGFKNESADPTHPTTLGAKAMAARTLADCPAIMQFD